MTNPLTLLAFAAAISLGLAASVLAADPPAAGTSARGENPPAPPAGAFNLRLLSDSTPDFSSRENFIYSAVAGWPTEQDRAAAQWRWFHRSRRVGTCVLEDGRPVLDPVLFFNSYGITYCSMIAQMNCSMWEARGMKNRVIDLCGHVVSEVFYDGGWHLFDNDFCNYWINEKGQVASTEELSNSRIHGNVADLKPGEYYLYDHCPGASSPRGRIFMGPSSTSVREVAKEWYPGPQTRFVREGFIGSHAGHRYVLGLRPNENYTRYYQALGTGEQFARFLPNGKDPMDHQVLRNNRANGRWHWKPDLSDPNVYYAAENVNIAKDGVTAKDTGKPAFVIFRVAAANVITSIKWTDETVGSLTYSVSGNNGLSFVKPTHYSTASDIIDGFGIPGAGPGKGWAIESVAGRLEYLLKVELKPGTPGARDALRTIDIETTTQVNPRTLPALRLGGNNMVVVSDGEFEATVLNPRLSADNGPKECYQFKDFQGMKCNMDFQPACVSTGDGTVVLRAVVPRPISRVRMAATIQHPEPGAEFFMQVSFDGGKNWKEIKHELFKGWPCDHRYEAMFNQIPQGAREVLMKYAFDFPAAGLVNVVAEADYAPPAGAFLPTDVTYCWSEWRGGKGWVERQHTERVTGPDHRYAINVGGDRPPRMNWVRVAPAAGDAKVGYSDGQDVGVKSAREDYRLELGTPISQGCKYELSRPAGAVCPDKNGLLTDGYISCADFYMFGDPREKAWAEGKPASNLAGLMACWDPGEELTITVDLGEAKTVAGARIAAVQPNPKTLYPEKMTVELSADGKTFAPAGTIGWEEVFFPPADVMQWEGTDSPVYEKLPAGGRLTYPFWTIFDKPAAARYVRFRLAPPADNLKSAGIALWEVQVFDKMARIPWRDTVRLPAPPGGAKQ